MKVGQKMYIYVLYNDLLNNKSLCSIIYQLRIAACCSKRLFSLSNQAWQYIVITKCEHPRCSLESLTVASPFSSHFSSYINRTHHGIAGALPEPSYETLRKIEGGARRRNVAVNGLCISKTIFFISIHPISASQNISLFTMSSSPTIARFLPLLRSPHQRHSAC